jgi:glutathione S-transferase
MSSGRPTYSGTGSSTKRSRRRRVAHWRIAPQVQADAKIAHHRVTQWCFAAVATVDPTFTSLDLVGIFDPQNHKLEREVRKLAHRWLEDIERRLTDRTWIASADFTVADIMMAGVLRNVRKTDLFDPFPNTKAYRDRCFARPAWERTLNMYAERFGVSVDAIR